jgi:hypothetical protein
MAPPGYTGYLAQHLDLIVGGCSRGRSSRNIAEQLYAAGARAGTSDGREPSQQQHIGNLTAMVDYILLRCGLRTRRRSRRQLTARPRTATDGTVVWDSS